VRGYGYKYDAINRIKSADYGEHEGTWESNTNKYNVSNIVYDENGNIKSISREGSNGIIDNLVFGYENNNNSNRLAFVSDNGGTTEGFKDGGNGILEYDYDHNGNMIADDNKGISSINYNYLNLPENINVSGGVVEYVYTASGIKLKNIHPDNTFSTYLGNFVFKENNELDYILMDEGRLAVNGTEAKYEYFLKDHLGNTRVVFDEAGAVSTQISHYYPFGMRFGNTSASSSNNNKYLYNGKEIQEELDWYDYGFRYYDATLGRWNVIDPMIEKHYDYTPYAYTYNNPILFIDVMGLDTVDINFNDDGIWEITNSQVVKGNDVFRVTKDGETTTHTFSEGEYGKRVNVLNLENTDDYTLGVYHVSGSKFKDWSVGYVVTPGGDASTEVGSGKRLPEDIYDLKASPEGTKWEQVWVTNGKANGDVSARGIKFHFGGSTPSDWTEGCFIFSSSYTKNSNNIQFNFNESRRATIWMDFQLGAQYVYRYAKQKYNGAGRIGANFGNTNLLNHKLIIKDGF